MTSVTQAPVPFFEDTRSLSEKLAGEDREWRPHQPEYDCPNDVYGLVLELGQYFSTYRDASGEYKVHTTARVLTEDNVVWSIVGFHGYLQSEFDHKKPRVGDFMAVAYKGTKPARKQGESDPNVYRMEVERNPAAPLPGMDDVGRKDVVSSPARPVQDEVSEEVDDDDGIPW